VLAKNYTKRPRAFIEEQNRLFDRRLAFWPRDDLRRRYRSDRYHDGIFDPLARHLDPLALTRGYARLARAKGARLFERSPAVVTFSWCPAPSPGARRCFEYHHSRRETPLRPRIRRSRRSGGIATPRACTSTFVPERWTSATR
jgi:hypothetical protein